MSDSIIIAICSAKGSPGVTTLSCALGAVWPTHRQIVVAECDPSGGDLAARFGLSAKRGMATLVVDSRHARNEDPVDLQGHTQSLPGGLEVLTGPTGAIASRTVDRELPNLLTRLRSSQIDLVLDLGRIQPGAPGQVAALAAADQVVVVAHRTVESVASTRWISQLLTRTEDLLRSDAASEQRGADRTKALSAHLGVVVVGTGHLLSEDAAGALGLHLLCSIPVDRLGASALRGEPVRTSRLERSELIHAARGIVKTIFDAHAKDPEAPDPPAGYRRSFSDPVSRDIADAHSFQSASLQGLPKLMDDEVSW